MKRPNPELTDKENPEWTEEDFAKAVPFSELPADLRTALSQEKHLAPDVESSSTREPAA